MTTGDLHLSIHLGQRWTAASVAMDGHIWTVTFEGQTRIPSGVGIDPHTGTVLVAAAGLAADTHPETYIPDPVTALRTSTGETDTRPAAAVSALLAHVANTASAQAGIAVSTLTVTTPQPWGPKSRQRLILAATTAGLPEPAIVTAAAAASVTGVHADDEAQGRFVLVCTIGDDYPELAVLDTTEQYTQLAATTVRDPDAPGIQHALAASIRQSAGGTKALAELDLRTAVEIDRARTALAGTPRTPILLPEQPGPVVLDVADLHKAAQPHLDQLSPALNQILNDADIDRTDLAATVLVAYDATAPDARAALTDAGLPPPTIITQPDQLASGAARLTVRTRARAAATAATTRLPRTRLTIRSLAAVAVLAAASAVLLIQIVTTANTWYLGGGTQVSSVALPVANLALAAALAATAATAAAQLAPTTWLSPQGMADPASTGYLLRRSYLAAAAAGLALAGLWGLGTGVGVEYSDPQYLRWALTAAIPIAACAAVVAVVSPRIPADRLPAWLARMRPPVWPIAAAAAGVYLVRAAFTLSFPVNLTGNPSIVAAIGAALLGAATAATATRHLGIRVAISLILVPGYALVVAVPTIGYLTAAYTATLIWWHLAATSHTVRDAAPDHVLTRWLAKT
jgi:hypothetical protein